MKFEWDETKNRVNIRKHGIDLASAREVFEGPMVIRADIRLEYGEDRWVALGFLRSRVVALVFAQPAPDTVRVISMRKANRYEQEEFTNALKD